jgi:hypothetical protein
MRIAIAALLCASAFEATGKEPRVVRWTTAEANKRIYKGRCPVRVIFTGHITSARAGEFTWAWKHSDGAMGPIRTVQADKPGETWRVHEVWEVAGTMRGWAQLWIPSERLGSHPARFRVQCKQAGERTANSR